MLRYATGFCVLAEELHFGRAATRLSITQPALSYQIRMLEREVGCPLVERSPQKVTLTEAGAGLARELGAALGQMDRAKQIAQNISRGSAGALTVGYCELPWSGRLARIVQTYSSQFPGVEISLRALATNEQAEGVAQGWIDVGFLHPPLPPGSLMLREAGEERLVAAMSPAHRLAGRVRLTMSDLAHERLIFCSGRSAPRLHGAVLEACARVGFTPKVHTTQDSWHAMGTEAIVGLGVAFVPETMASTFAQHLVFKPLADFNLRLQTAIATTSGTLRPAVAHFVEVATSVLISGSTYSSPTGEPALSPLRG